MLFYQFMDRDMLQDLDAVITFKKVRNSSEPTRDDVVHAIRLLCIMTDSAAVQSRQRHLRCKGMRFLYHLSADLVATLLSMRGGTNSRIQRSMKTFAANALEVLNHVRTVIMFGWLSVFSFTSHVRLENFLAYAVSSAKGKGADINPTRDGVKTWCSPNHLFTYIGKSIA